MLSNKTEELIDSSRFQMKREKIDISCYYDKNDVFKVEGNVLM